MAEPDFVAPPDYAARDHFNRALTDRRFMHRLIHALLAIAGGVLDIAQELTRLRNERQSSQPPHLEGGSE